ncbi:hypothetical protein ACF1BQ_013145 [Bradyrhizobium sp. RDT10]
MTDAESRHTSMVRASVKHHRDLDVIVLGCPSKSPASMPGDRKYGHVMKCED